MKFSKLVSMIMVLAMVVTMMTFALPVSAATITYIVASSTSPSEWVNQANYICTNGELPSALKTAIQSGGTSSSPKVFRFAPGMYWINGTSREFYIGSYTTIIGVNAVTQPTDLKQMMYPDSSTKAVFASHSVELPLSQIPSTEEASWDNIGHIRTVSGATNITVQDVELYGHTTLKLQHTSNSTIRNVLIHNYRGTYPNGNWCNMGYREATGSLWLYGSCNNITIENCNIQCSSHHALTLHTDSNTSYVSSNITITGCRALHAGCGQLKGDNSTDISTSEQRMPYTNGFGYRDWSCGFDLCEGQNINNVTVRNCYAWDAWKVGFYTEPEETGGNVQDLSLYDCRADDSGQRAIVPNLSPRKTIPKETEACNFFFQGGYFENCISYNGEKSGWLIMSNRTGANKDNDCRTKMVNCGDRGSPKSIVTEMNDNTSIHCTGFKSILPTEYAYHLYGSQDLSFTGSTILCNTTAHPPIRLGNMRRQQFLESVDPDNASKSAPGGYYDVMTIAETGGSNFTGTVYYYPSGNMVELKSGSSWNGSTNVSTIGQYLTRSGSSPNPDDYIPVNPNPGATPTPVPTPTPTPPPVNPENPIDLAYSVMYPDWHNNAHNLGTSNTGNQTVNFDVTPLGNGIDSQIAYVDTSTVLSGTGYDQLALQVRMAAEGYFDVRNGGAFAKTATVNYTANTKYHVEIQANMSAGTYSVWVTPNGGSKTQIASNYAFRSSAPATNDLGKVYFISDTANNLFKIENHVVGTANLDQNPPIGLTGVAPTTPQNNNGKITGTTTAMEYKPAAGSTYTVCSSPETTGLASGDYVVRYAAKPGYNASPTTAVTVPNQEQSAPTGLVGVAPTSAANNDGKITGTTTAMEYKLSTGPTYITCSATQTTGLAAGDYLVRYAAKTGYNASPAASVTVPAYQGGSPVYYSYDENTWTQHSINLGSTNTGKRHIEFDVTPFQNNIDGSVDYADTSTVVTGFDQLAMLVRFNVGGYFDVRNGATFTKTNTVNYTANTKYRVEIIADMNAATYSVYVTPNGGARTQVANNYAFRSTAPATNDIGQLFVVSEAANSLFKVENHRVSASYDSFDAATWVSNGINLGSGNTGNQSIEFDLTPQSSGIDGSADFADTSANVTGFDQLAVQVRFNPAGYFDARNGSAFAKTATVNYTANNRYHVRITVNMTSKTYNVYIKPYNGTETQIASNYAFRSGCPPTDDMGKLFVVSEAANNLFKLDNLTLTAQ